MGRSSDCKLTGKPTHAQRVLQTPSLSMAGHPASASRPTHDQLVVLDWDDTTFPTTYFNEHVEFSMLATGQLVWSKLRAGHCLEALRQNLTISGGAALRMLMALYGVSRRNVLIVTSGVEGWLQNSMRIAG